MGLLDGILGNVLGSVLGGGAPQGGTGAGADASSGQKQAGLTPLLLQLALQLLQQNGGLTAILEKLKQAGLGKQASSWVSTGENHPVTGDQISQALGADTLNQLGAQTGMDPNQVSHALAQVLPDLVNQMTPDGQVPENDQDIINDGLDALRRGGTA